MGMKKAADFKKKNCGVSLSMRFSGNNNDMTFNHMGILFDFDLLCIVTGKRLSVSGIGQEQANFIAGASVIGVRLLYQKFDHVAGVV
jgi:hypothetical protein